MIDYIDKYLEKWGRAYRGGASTTSLSLSYDAIPGTCHDEEITEIMERVILTMGKERIRLIKYRYLGNFTIQGCADAVGCSVSNYHKLMHGIHSYIEGWLVGKDLVEYYQAEIPDRKAQKARIN